MVALAPTNTPATATNATPAAAPANPTASSDNRDASSNPNEGKQFGKNHWRNRKYKAKLKQQRAHYLQMVKKDAPAQQPPKPILAKDRSAKDRTGATVMDRVGVSVRDRLDLRPESRESIDSGVNMTSPTPPPPTPTPTPTPDMECRVFH